MTRNDQSVYPGFDQTTLLVGYRKKAVAVNPAFTAEHSATENTSTAELKTLEKTETTTTAIKTKTSETIAPSDVVPTTTSGTVAASDTPSSAVRSTTSTVHLSTLPGNIGDHLYFDQHPVVYTHIDPRQHQQLQVEDNSSYRSYDQNNVIGSSSIALPPDAIIDHLALDAAGDHLADFPKSCVDFLLPGPADFLINQVTL